MVQGDTEPAVLGACMVRILELGERGALEVVVSFVGEEDVRGLEAMAAMAQSRRAESFRSVIERWRRGLGIEAHEAIAISLGASPLEEAREALLKILENSRGEGAVYAVTGLARSRYREAIRALVRGIVEGKREVRAAEAFRVEFG